MITFGARYVSPVNVERVLKKTSVPCQASFYELNTKSRKDSISFNLASHRLRNILNFAPTIYQHFVSTMTGINKDSSSKYFALVNTTKKRTFVSPFKISGLAEISDSDSGQNTIRIKYLQKIPQFFFERINHVGTGMIDGIKAEYPDKDIVLKALPNVVGFYLANGFVIESKDPHSRLVNMRYYAKC